MARVVGLIGKIGSGKTTVGDYFKENYGASEHRFSTILSDILKRLHKSRSRENLQALGASLREALGPDVIVNAFRKDLDMDDAEFLIVDGIRYENEVAMLKDIPGSVIIYVDAPSELRYERAVRRGERGEGDLTFQEFLANDEAETEKRIDSLKTSADHVILNASSLEELAEEIDRILKGE